MIPKNYRKTLLLRITLTKLILAFSHYKFPLALSTTAKVITLYLKMK